MFQPGEEGFHGARFMLEDGLLQGLDIKRSRAFAIHISTMCPSGEVHLRPGPLLASADKFRITVRGRGGHASMPQDASTRSPIAAEIVTALEIAVTRRVNVRPGRRDRRAHRGRHHPQHHPLDRVPQGTYRTTSDVRRAATRTSSSASRMASRRPTG